MCNVAKKKFERNWKVTQVGPSRPPKWGPSWNPSSESCWRQFGPLMVSQCRLGRQHHRNFVFMFLQWKFQRQRNVIVCQTFSGEFPKKYSGSWEGRYISGTYLDQWVKPITLHIQAWKSTSTFLSISLHRCRFATAVERRWFELHLVLLQSRL